MRADWLQILFISVALHVIGGVALLLSTSPGREAMLPSDPPESLTLLLRSENSVAPTTPRIVASLPSPAPLKVRNHVGPLAVIKVAAPRPAPTPSASNAFALRDKAHAAVRPVSDALLCPATAPAVDSRGGIVFILDISGSMYEPDSGSTRLALARQLVADRIRALKDGTPFALVVYGETARRSGPLILASDATRPAAIDYLDQEFDCGGGTNLPAGLELARELQPGSILVATDGDLNMAASELLPRVHQILGGADESPAFTIVAIDPRASTSDELLLRKLAHQQGGNYLSSKEEDLTRPLAPRKSDLAVQ